MASLCSPRRSASLRTCHFVTDPYDAAPRRRPKMTRPRGRKPAGKRPARPTPKTVDLTPAQEVARRAAHTALAAGPIVLLWGRAGSGRTTVLRRLHADLGGAFLALADLIGPAAERHPLAI